MPGSTGEPSRLHRGNSRTTLRNTRRVVQVVSLVLWLGLFLLTRHQAIGWMPPDLFLVTDPLVAAITMGAAHVFVPAMLASLVLVALGLALGRVFCGWLCPLGTLIDAAAKLVRPPSRRLSPGVHGRMLRWKYYILAFLLAGALLSSQWVYLLDPLVILFRGVASGIYPLAGSVLPGELGTTFVEIPLLPFTLLLAVLGLTAITPRFYCRYLCPLGALYGLLARAPLLRRRVKGCDACAGLGTGKQCVHGCRMGAVPANPHRTRNHECIRCFSGRSLCHVEAIRFDLVPPGRAGPLGADRRKRQIRLPPSANRRLPDTRLELDRRRFLLVGAAGLGLAPVVAASSAHRGEPNRIVRPPRVLEEETFLDQCVRCGQCVQACPTQTLQLTHLESGLAGLWTPALTPRIQGCIADCNACSVACPSGAIPSFSKAEADKWAVKMGTAVLEKNRCISYTGDLPCAKCIEICPTKAFILEPRRGKRPLRPFGVDYVRCVGCGLCEYACSRIVFGRPALLTFARGRGQPTSLRYQPTQAYEPPQGGS